MGKVIASLVFLLMVEVCAPQSQHFQFQHYGVDDGLSQSKIEAIFQDSRGYLWIGTAKGLNKFNGHRFEVFLPSSDSSKTSLSHQSVYAIAEDSYGNIWAGTRRGVSKYDPRTKTFTNYSEVGDCESCLAGTMSKTLFEDFPYMYVGSNAGLSRIHLETGEVKGWWHTPETKNIPDIYSIRDIVKLDYGELMLATHDGLVFFNIETETFRLVSKKDGLPDKGNGVEKIYKDTEGTYWLAMANSGVVKLKGNPTQPTFEQLPVGETGIPSETVYDIIEYPQGTLWFASHEGIVRYNRHKKTYSDIRQRAGDALSISANDVTHLLVDRANRIWLGSNYGLDVYDPYLNQFEMLTATKDKTKGLAANNTTAIFQDSQGAIWFGNAENGITVLQQKKGEELFHHIPAGNAPNQLPHPTVYGIGEDAEGKIYIATGARPVVVNWPDREKYDYTMTPLPIGQISENKLPTPYIYNFRRDAKGNLWLPTHGKGVIKVEKDGKFVQFLNENQDPTLISSDFVIDVSLEGTKAVWTTNSGTGFGIIQLDKNDSVVRRFRANHPFTKIATHSTLLHKGSIFFNTNEGAFFYRDRNVLFKEGTLKSVHFNEGNGLSDNSINKLIPVSDTTFWASTGNGLSLLNISSEKATSYKYIAGAKNREFNRNAGILDRDSIIYFGGISGVVRFKPRNFKKNTCAPRVSFTHAKIWNRPVPIGNSGKNETTIEKDIAFLNTVTLNPKDKVFSVRIDAINFTLPVETQYAYKLEGFDADWTTTSNPEITYTNLDPGSYTLLARAANNDGLWSDTRQLTIEVLPPWWRTWWAYLLFAVVIGSTIYLFMKLRLQQERRLELARAQEREIFRKRSSRDFHDEAGTRITRIALITELAKLHSKENEEMQDYLAQIDTNLQDLNNGMRDFIWTLDPTKDNAYDTLTRFAEFAGNFCEYASIQFRSQHISQNLKELELNMAERRHLLLILKEALNNCVKHAQPTAVDFIIEFKTGRLTIILKDNGNGFDPLQANTGNGMNNMQERADASGGALQIYSEVNGGTKLLLTLETTRLGN